jgi:ATP-dependent helicase/nuclease subunit B
VAPAVAATAIRDAALGGVVGASAPRPGHIHVVPSDSAGFAGRRHLYVVGLDAETSSPSPLEDALLPDRDREEIDPSGELLDRGADRAGAQSWTFARMLGRVPIEGSITLCASAHELVGGNVLFPGGLLLRAADLAGLDLADIIEPKDAPAALVPNLLVHPALHDVEVDLALRQDPDRQREIASRHPVASLGRHADEERASSRWTPYDGWLGAPRPELDPLATDGTVSPTRLEALATCPYRYFLQYVLHIKTPPEALDEEELLTPAERGTLLHSVFEQFTRGLNERGERPDAAHEDEIVALTEELIDAALAQRGDPAPAARAALGRAMTEVSRVFLRDEVRHASIASPIALEHPFGHGEPVTLELAADVVLRLRGFVDRVEQRSDGSFEVVDYKTGSAFGYADEGQVVGEVLARGRRLQWALYAHALQQSEGWNVTHAGYRFVSMREYAERRSYPLPPARDVADVLRQVVAPARGGFFPQVPDERGACRFCDVRRACGDVGRRAREVREIVAQTSADVHAEPVLHDWSVRHAR